MCVLEAMACGCVVVCSDRGGLPEVVGNAGEVVQLDAEKFSEKILHLVGNEKLRKRYFDLAVKRAANFSWEKIATDTLQLYKQNAKYRKPL